MLAQTPAGARLIMQNGNIEQAERMAAPAFGAEIRPLRLRSRQLRDRSGRPSARPANAIFPSCSNPQIHRSEPGRHVAASILPRRITGSRRRSIVIAFALIALAATAKGHMGRASYALRLSGAALMGAALRLRWLRGTRRRRRAALHSCAFLYLLPLVGISDWRGAILADVPLVPARSRRLFARAPREADDMTWSLTLMGYLARRFMLSVLMVFSAFVALALSIDLADLFSRTSRSRHSDRRHPQHEPAQAARHRAEIDAVRGAARAPIFAFSRMSTKQRARGDARGRRLGLAIPDAARSSSPSGSACSSMTVFSPVAAAFLSQYARLEARYVHGPGVTARGVPDRAVAAPGRRSSTNR